jgi:hypothetical protein
MTTFLGYFMFSKKSLWASKNSPMGKNSANLVTLLQIHLRKGFVDLTSKSDLQRATKVLRWVCWTKSDLSKYHVKMQQIMSDILKFGHT